MFGHVFCKNHERAEEIARAVIDCGSWDGDYMEELAFLLGIDTSECEYCEEIATLIFDKTGVDLG